MISYLHITYFLNINVIDYQINRILVQINILIFIYILPIYKNISHLKSSRIFYKYSNQRII